MASLTLTTAPTIEPVSLDDARVHLRLDPDDHAQDAYLETLITAARESVEAHTSRALINQTWTLKLDGFPGSDGLVLPRAPLSSVTSLSYVDDDGATQVWASSNYVVSAPSGPRPPAGRLWLAYDISWPTGVRSQRDSVIVVFVAGYGATAASVPAVFRQSILLLVAEMHERREEGIVGAAVTTVQVGIDRLLASYVVGGW